MFAAGVLKIVQQVQKKIIDKEYAPMGVYEQILKDIAFYGENGGFTFSGGECMMQIEPLPEVIEISKANGIHTSVDTAGYVLFKNF